MPTPTHPRAAPDGHADGPGGQAQRRQRGDGRDRAQPAAGPRPAATWWRRSAASAPIRASSRPCSARATRTPGAVRAACGRCARSAAAARAGAARSPRKRCRSRWPWSCCWSRTASSSGSPPASGCCRSEPSATLIPNEPGHAVRLRAVAEGEPVADRATMRRSGASRCRRHYLEAGLVQRARRAACRTAAARSARSPCARARPSASATTKCASSNRCRTCWPPACSARRREEALNHAQRLESVGQLTGGIAHDFNNLLTVIQGNLQVLEELPALRRRPATRSNSSARPRAPARRGAELTSKLLAFSRRQVLQPTRVDVAALLQLAGRHAAPHARPAHRASTLDVPADCPPCLADPGQLESALLNIAINARDAMPAGRHAALSAAAPVAALPDDVRRRARRRRGRRGTALSRSRSPTPAPACPRR